MRAAGLLVLALLLPGAAHAQLFGGSGRGAGRHENLRQDGAPPRPPAERLTPKPPPRQRLDAGALLCRSEAELAQHQATVEARLDGQDAAEPVGCRPIRTMMPVTVLDRHGPARTQVHLAGPPEQTGWTDATVRDQ